MKVGDLDICHPDYQGPAHRDWRQLMYGPPPAGPGRAEAFRRWLPKRPGEKAAAYTRRIDGALYTNDVAPLVEGLASRLFSTPLELRNIPTSDWWQAWPTNVDRAGTSLSPYMQARLVDALVHQSAYVWPVLPARRAPHGAGRAEQERAGDLDVYLVAWTGEQVIRWGEDAGGRLSWLVAREVVEPQSFGDSAGPVRRWTYLDAEVVRQWEAPVGVDAEVEAKLVAEVEHGYGRLPVARLMLPDAMHALRQVRDPAIRLLRARCGEDHAREEGAYAGWAFFTDVDLDNLVGGEGFYLRLPKDATAQRLGTDAATHAVLREAVNACRDDLYRVRQALFAASAQDAAGRQSGAAQREARSGLEVSLTGYHLRMLDFVREVLDIVGAARGESEEVAAISIGGLDSWQQLDIDEWTRFAPLATELWERSETARKLRAKREAAVLFAGAPELAEIDREIDDSPSREDRDAEAYRRVVAARATA